MKDVKEQAKAPPPALYIDKEIDWPKEWELFKSSIIQDFSAEYLAGFDFKDGMHHKYEILPKDYRPCRSEELLKQDHNFRQLNYGWDMWCASLLTQRPEQSNGP